MGVVEQPHRISRHHRLNEVEDRFPDKGPLASSPSRIRLAQWISRSAVSRTSSTNPVGPAGDLGEAVVGRIEPSASQMT